MEDNELQKRMEDLKEKLHKAQRQLAGYREKSKILEKQYEDARNREQKSGDLVMELLERQRELNVMLNRANIMLHRTQEAMALTSLEFNEMAKALPEPKKAEWAERVAKINELFKKTGIQDAEVDALESTNPPPPTEDSLDGDELKKESEHAFERKHSIWSRNFGEVPHVEAEPVDDHPHQPEPAPEPESYAVVEGQAEEEPEESRQSKKSWWQRIAG